MKKILSAIALVLVTSIAFAAPGFLDSESANGALRYCKYSNGVVITIKDTAMCPAKVN